MKKTFKQKRSLPKGTPITDRVSTMFAPGEISPGATECVQADDMRKLERKYWKLRRANQLLSRRKIKIIEVNPEAMILTDPVL